MQRFGHPLEIGCKVGVVVASGQRRGSGGIGFEGFLSAKVDEDKLVMFL